MYCTPCEWGCGYGIVTTISVCAKWLRDLWATLAGRLDSPVPALDFTTLKQLEIAPDEQLIAYFEQHPVPLLAHGIDLASPAAWQAQDFGTSLPVPSFVWDIPDSGGTYVAAQIVGADAVDGVETHVLTFFLDLPQTPVWFRLWSDSSGLVRRASMRAQGHFMDHRYTDFDTAPSIEPTV
jgi:hypothetical protein